MEREEIFRMLLSGVVNLTLSELELLLMTFSTCEEIVRASEDDILSAFGVRDCVKKEIITFRRKTDPFEAVALFEKKGIKYVSIESKEYPGKLKKIPDPPTGLFFVGELPREDCPSIAVIGSRDCSTYGKNVSLRFAGELAKAGYDVISGMARGIDGYSHRGALNAGGKSFAVLGSGVDVCYPQGNRDIYERMKTSGGIISEYYPGTAPLPAYFPRRNRIISGLSDAILVIEAREKSGTLITVDQGLEQGRQIFAVPGRIDDELSRGCNRLIMNGAVCAAATDIIIEETAPIYGILNRAESSNSGRSFDDPMCEKVYRALSSTPTGADELCRKTGLSVVEVLTALTKLELENACERAGSSMFARI